MTTERAPNRRERDMTPTDPTPLREAAIRTRDLLAWYCFSEDDSGDDDDLVAAYDELRAILGPSTEEGVAATRSEPDPLDVERLSRDALYRRIHSIPSLPHHGKGEQCFPITDAVIAALAATEGSEP